MLAVLLTKGCVSSSMIPRTARIIKMVTIIVSILFFFTDKKHSSVIPAYAEKCTILSKPLIFHPPGSICGGRCVRHKRIIVQITETISHLRSKEYLIIGVIHLLNQFTDNEYLFFLSISDSIPLLISSPAEFFLNNIILALKCKTNNNNELKIITTNKQNKLSLRI